jgi:L-iditol 2-dehydrogenase
VGLTGLDGACAEQVVVPEKAVHPLPAGLDMEVGALVEPATVAFRALARAQPLAGRRLVVLGAGPVGLLVAALARAQGAGWVAVAGLEEERLRVARALGCDETFGPAEGDLEQAVLAATAGEGADVVIEATGDARLIPTALAVAAPGADIVLLSLYKERPVMLVADAIVSKDLTIHGSIASPGVWERTLRLLGGRVVDLRPLISHRFPLARADAAFQAARRRDSGAIKVLILPHASGVGEVDR